MQYSSAQYSIVAAKTTFILIDVRLKGYQLVLSADFVCYMAFAFTSILLFIQQSFIMYVYEI